MKEKVHRQSQYEMTKFLSSQPSPKKAKEIKNQNTMAAGKIYRMPTFPVRPVCVQHHAPKPPKCPCSLPIDRITVMTREVPVDN